jgi:deferrochelatase/peroxidase EfeB
MPTNTVDFHDLQGLVRFGFGALTESCFLLLKIRNAETARTWLADAPITNAVELAQPPDTAVQIAFTAPGLRAIGLSDNVLAGYSNEFLSGIAGDESRSRRLGDVGSNSPSTWAWGGTEDGTPHLALLLYSKPGGLGVLQSQIRGLLWADAFEELTCLPTSDMKGLDPFGFKDGVSQPEIDWERTRGNGPATYDYTNRVALGEFLLGYPNEYGKYTDRPLLPAPRIPTSNLERAEDDPTKLDLGLNSSYLVFRHLQQDVRAFWQFAQQTSNGNSVDREKLAAAMVGRQRTGEPVVPLSDQLIEGIKPKDARDNNFTYLADRAGIGCPLGSHIRRTNPRTADMPPDATSAPRRLIRALGFPQEDLREDIISSARFHRLLRRGREYGSTLPIEEALQPAPPAEQERGIYFLCLGANIARQFEFVQSAWSLKENFDGLTGEVDPLLGPRCPIFGGQPTDSFSIPQRNQPRRHISGMPQFVTVRGGAYFVLPSISALKYIARTNA